jgi:hypothetical protein
MLSLGFGLTIAARRGSPRAPNLWTFPSALDNAVWTKTRATVTPDADGVADKLVEDTTATNTHLLGRTSAGVDNATFTFSGEFKAVERGRLALFFFDADALTNSIQVDVNLTARTTGQILAGAATLSVRTATLLSDGYVRVVVQGVANTGGSGGLINWQLRIGNATGVLSYTGDGASGLLVRNLGLAQGSTPAT